MEAQALRDNCMKSYLCHLKRIWIEEEEKKKSGKQGLPRTRRPVVFCTEKLGQHGLFAFGV